MENTIVIFKTNKDFQKELQDLADYILSKENLLAIKVKIKFVKQGRANINSRKITIPIWAIDRGLHFLCYYLLHEISHFICFDKNLDYGHHFRFKDTERRLLNEVGIIPIYKKAYIKQLNGLNNKCLYNEKKYLKEEVGL